MHPNRSVLGAKKLMRPKRTEMASHRASANRASSTLHPHYSPRPPWLLRNFETLALPRRAQILLLPFRTLRSTCAARMRLLALCAALLGAAAEPHGADPPLAFLSSLTHVRRGR